MGRWAGRGARAHPPSTAGVAIESRPQRAPRRSQRHSTFLTIPNGVARLRSWRSRLPAARDGDLLAPTARMRNGYLLTVIPRDPR